MSRQTTTLRRLLDALEDIGRREDGALALGDGIAFAELERRAEPLARRIFLLTDGKHRGLAPDLIDRGRSLVADRHERHHRLMILLENTRGEIGGIDQARARARALRPAYSAARAGTVAAPLFSGLG